MNYHYLVQHYKERFHNLPIFTDNKVPIFISSCIEYEDYNVGRILDNISETDIPRDNVFFIMGGYEKESYEKRSGCHIIKVPWRCFEFTPLRYVAIHPDSFKFDYAFFTHDTVKFGPTFYSKLIHYISKMKTEKYESIKLEPVSMNIGIYTKELILKNIDVLNTLNINTNDKSILWKLKNTLVDYEDFILNKGKQYPEHIGLSSVEQLRLPNKDGQEQNVLKKYFNGIDLIKIQTNFGAIYSINPASIENFSELKYSYLKNIIT